MEILVEGIFKIYFLYLVLILIVCSSVIYRKNSKSLNIPKVFSIIVIVILSFPFGSSILSKLIIKNQCKIIQSEDKNIISKFSTNSISVMINSELNLWLLNSSLVVPTYIAKHNIRYITWRYSSGDHAESTEFIPIGKCDSGSGYQQWGRELCRKTIDPALVPNGLQIQLFTEYCRGIKCENKPLEYAWFSGTRTTITITDSTTNKLIGRFRYFSWNSMLPTLFKPFDGSGRCNGRKELAEYLDGILK